MRYIRVAVVDAERAKRKLLSSMLLDKQRSVLHSDSYVLFPIVNISEARVKKLFATDSLSFSVVRGRGQDRVQAPGGFRGELVKVLTRKELENAVKGYDILGNIAIIDVPGPLRRKERRIADVIFKVHPSVRTVIAKAGAVYGKYRRRKFRYIAGERTFVANYRENGCVFNFDVRKSFFSIRLSYERSRVSSLVKNGEKVLVMFAGVGPFAIEIAKDHKDAEVIGVELNRAAYQSMVDNIKLNRLGNVKPILGGVKKVAPKLRGFADRIVMPMPKESERFLDQALMAAKKNAIVHIYAFGPTSSVAKDLTRKIRDHAKIKGYKAIVKFERTVRAYSPQEIEIVLDYKITK